ncbi:hypothetical protein [Flavobacterium pallidum]|uniref:hypothetical protein n=1 Tax=Flavobacterium pallidum TaxID=2172098 RepID=UPI0011B26BDB|nr:hypothetical protein [Flavobacterium pallidum]
MSRVIIYVKDVCVLMGTSDKTSRGFMKTLRIHANKGRNVPLTAYDFSSYTKMDPQEVIRIINGK